MIDHKSPDQHQNAQLSKPFKHKIVIIFLSISFNICFGCLIIKFYFWWPWQPDFIMELKPFRVVDSLLIVTPIMGLR